MGSTEAVSDQESGTISENSVAGRGGSQLKRVLPKCLRTAMVSWCPTLIYELAVKIYMHIFGKQSFLPAATPPGGMILLDLTDLKRAGLSQNLDDDWQ